jgi:outer membrane biosynthesis protein TonB
MKSCPKCNRTYPDEGQKFCTFDGGLLIAPQTLDPNATIRATTIDLNAAAERPTSRDLPDPNATIIENYPATIALPRNTGPTTGPTGTSPNTSDIARPPAAPPPTPPPPPPPPVSVTPPPPPPPPAQQSTPATVEVPAPAPSAPLPPPVAKKKSKVPLIIAGVLVFLLLSGGALAAVFFFVIKPKLDEMAAERNPGRPAEISTPTPSASVEAPSPAPTAEDTFVPPANTVQFVNSNENLDGKLAEHYFDFSFYYPSSWTRDTKAGVPGATNFVKVERALPPNFIQENFVVGWYTSSGTFVGDMPTYPQRVEQLSRAFEKLYPDYKKVSESPTKVNSMDAYEFRWEGLSRDTDRGDIKLWGRVIFLPTGKEGDTTGATLSLLCTSLAGELSSVEDVGERGEAPVILESFRFGKKK